MDDYIRYEMLYHIERAVKNWGIEGTEEKLKELYNNRPQLKYQYLSIFYELYPFLKR